MEEHLNDEKKRNRKIFQQLTGLSQKYRVLQEYVKDINPDSNMPLPVVDEQALADELQATAKLI